MLSMLETKKRHGAVPHAPVSAICNKFIES